MLIVSNIGPRLRENGNWWGVLVAGLGFALGFVELFHIQAMSDPLAIVLEAILPFIGAIGLVMAGYILWSERYIYNRLYVQRVVAWTIAGIFGLGVIFVWILAHQFFRGGSFHHAHFILVNNLIAGGLIGFVVGTYDARTQTYKQSIDQERLKLEFLHRELRHHILNALNIILGQIDLVEQELDGSSDRLSRALREATEIVNRVEEVRMITDAFTDDTVTTLSRQNLSKQLIEVIEATENRFQDASIEATIPDNLEVQADQYISAVFENLIRNAIEHNDKPTPEVEVSATQTEDLVKVFIEDNGPGLSESRKDSLSQWSESSKVDIGKGVGLAIVTVLVDRYEGEMKVEDNDPTGTRVTVEFPKAH